LTNSYQQERNSNNCCQSSVEGSAALDARPTVLAVLSQSSAGEVCCNTGVASSGISGSDSEVLVVVDALELGLMHGSSVVASGCGCGPSHDLGFVAVDGQSEASFDFVDGVPADSCCNQGIHDRDSLVVDVNARMHEQHPSEAGASRDQAETREVLTISKKDHLQQKQEIKTKDNAGHNNCGCGSKSNQIGHLTILPAVTVTSAQEGK
ncbi:MAG: hypothetical protein RL719_1183, partial [Actinomycetota bacterium]